MLRLYELPAEQTDKALASHSDMHYEKAFWP